MLSDWMSVRTAIGVLDIEFLFNAYKPITVQTLYNAPHYNADLI